MISRGELMKKEKSCGAVVIDNDKVLIVKHNLGHWDFPKGHMEKGETEEDTAIREVKEETNVDIEIDNQYRHVVTYHPKENVIKDVVYFLAKPLTKHIIHQQEEVSIAQFVSFEEAFERLTYDNAKNILRDLLDDMNK